MRGEPLPTLAGVATAAALVLAAAFGACLAGPQGDAKRSAAPPAGASAEMPRPEMRRAEVRFPNGYAVAAEIADTPALQQRGYMFRAEVKAGEGMLFLFPEPDVHPFWMKNTLVPLDILWMDGQRTIVHIEADVPPCKADPCPGYGTPRKVSAVLEVRAGTAAAQGLKVGDRLTITIPESAD